MTPQNKIRFLAMDLDGTILTSDKKVTERTRNAIIRAGEAGIEPVIVTGRPLKGLPEELLDIPQIRYAITSNGAVTSILHTGQNLRTALIPPEDAALICRIPQEQGLLYNIFIDGAGYSDPDTYRKLIDSYTGTVLEDYVRKSRRSTDHLQELILHSRGIENIWMLCGENEYCEHVSTYITEHFSFHTIFAGHMDIEVGAPGADKGEAVTELAGMLGISREQILAIGDNTNDLGMLKAAGICAVMGNAPEAVKQMADLTADHNDRDGAAKIIEQFL